MIQAIRSQSDRLMPFLLLAIALVAALDAGMRAHAQGASVAGAVSTGGILLAQFAGVVGGLMLVGTVALAALSVALSRPRSKDRAHMASVRTFRDGDRDVVFVEMCHVGPEAYFARVKGIVADEVGAGATYLYEGVRPGDTTPEERERLSRILGIAEGARHNEFMAWLAVAAGWVHQPVLRPEDAAQARCLNVDLDCRELLDALDDAGLGERKAVAKDPPHRMVAYAIRDLVAGFAWRNGERFPVLRRAVGRMFRTTVLAMAGRKSPELDPANALIDRLRDRRLALAVQRIPGDLVITYGGDHFPAFRAFMESRGAREVYVEVLPFG